MRSLLAGEGTGLGRARTVLWILAGALMAASLLLGVTGDFPLPPILLAAAFLTAGAVGRLDLRRLLLLAGLIVLGGVALLDEVHRVAGAAGLGFWLRVLSLWLAAWLAVDGLAAIELLHPGR